MNILSVLNQRAATQGEKPAYVFLKDGENEDASITYAALRQAAREAAATLAAHCAPQSRVLLALPDGIEFVVAFLGCLYAGLVAVPVKPPQNRESSRKVLKIAEDSGAALLMCSPATLMKLNTFFPGEQVLTRMQYLDPQVLVGESMALGDTDAGDAFHPDTLAFLQYTSGSTGAPKGVMVSHANLIANEEMIRRRWGAGSDEVYLSWLPMFHDMGLIGAVLQSLYQGSTCVLMPPMAFVQKPTRWMAAASKYRATITGGPNFAFRSICSPRAVEAAAGLDLSALRITYCGSEPISPAVVHDFLFHYGKMGLNPKSFSPCYGMAETTLMVSAGGIGEAPRFARLPLHGKPLVESLDEVSRTGFERAVVSCGNSVHGQELRIVNPQTFQACAEGDVGEVWAHGAHIAQGYWHNEEATRTTFQACIAGEPARPHLRTGDLGFMLGDQLFITGRIKELMIFNGSNHYPQDIEESITGCHPAVAGVRAVAFSRLDAGVEGLVIVQEIDREYMRRMPQSLADEIGAAIKAAIYAQHSVLVRELVLVRHSAIPRTTSGKICRVSCKQQLLDGTLERLDIAPAEAATTEPA